MPKKELLFRGTQKQSRGLSERPSRVREGCAGDVPGTFSRTPTRGRGMKKGLFPPGTSFKAYLPSPDWLRNGVEHPLTKIGGEDGSNVIETHEQMTEFKD